MNKEKDFLNLVEQSTRILVTSHISPDPDAITSVLLFGKAIEENYKDKKVKLVLEEKPEKDLSFLKSYKEIHFTDVLEATKGFEPDLFVIVDAMNYERVSRENSAELKELVAEELGAKLAIIDHHTAIGLEKSDVYINTTAPATAAEIYDLLFRKLGLKSFDGYADIALLGIVSDTNRFLYDHKDYRKTFDLAAELLDGGASIEKLENQMGRIEEIEAKVLANLFLNMTDSDNGYTYSFVDDDLAKQFMGKDEELRSACNHFVNSYIKNYKDNHWGFLVYPQYTGEKLSYSATFRSLAGEVDVSKIAQKLGGGGHKPAAGAKDIMASDVESAVKFVESVIAEELSA